MLIVGVRVGGRCEVGRCMWGFDWLVVKWGAPHWCGRFGGLLGATCGGGNEVAVDLGCVDTQ